MTKRKCEVDFFIYQVGGSDKTLTKIDDAISPHLYTATNR